MTTGNSSTPLVSVIIPAYKAEAFLGKTIESVQAQTMPDWELIVSDDGSPDRTAEVADGYAAEDSRIRVLRNPPVHHPAAARTAGMKAAAGHYCAMLDADDLWVPEKLEVQLEAIQAVARPGLSYTQVTEFWDLSQPAPAIWPREAPFQERERQFRQFLLLKRLATPSTWLIERTFAREIGDFAQHPEMKMGEDVDFVLRCLAQRPAIFIPKPLTLYRISESSLTWTVPHQWKGLMEIVRRASERGDLTPKLEKKAYSMVHWVRGETLLREGDPGWRGAFWHSWRLDPMSARRAAGLIAPCLPTAVMRSLYKGLHHLKTSLARDSSR